MNRDTMMYKAFGYGGKGRCKDCSHLRTVQAGTKAVYKCECYGLSASSATDWRRDYFSCGLFNQPYEGRPLKDCKPPAQPKAAEVYPGQISLFG